MNNININLRRERKKIDLKHEEKENFNKKL